MRNHPTTTRILHIGAPMKDCSNKRSTRKNGLSVLRVQIYDVFVGRFVNFFILVAAKQPLVTLPFW